MGQRQDLQTLLESFGAEKVYFDAPESVHIVYPCIIYELNDVRTNYADDLPFNRTKQYLVMVIAEDPDTPIPDRIGALPMCAFDRHYTADNLHHFVFRLFF